MKGLRRIGKILPSTENSRHDGPKVKEHTIYFAKEKLRLLKPRV